MFEPGEVLVGKYTVIRLLGEGGMGCVYEAQQEALGIPVALKVLRDEAMAEPEAVARFAREAKASAVLRGPHTARVFDVGVLADGRPFMVMELLQGHDLGVELEKRRQIPPAEAVNYVMQACEAIGEAHEIGIVHRDLKPANIFLARAGSRTSVKILDFGISRFDKAGEARVTQTQSAFGTPLYMSPEAVRSAKHTDVRADIWALGVILYELIAGVTPFLGETPTAVAVAISVDAFKPLSELVPGIPAELDEIVARALQKDPNRRFQTVVELSDALAPFGPAASRMSLPGLSGQGTAMMKGGSSMLDTGSLQVGAVARTAVFRPAEDGSRRLWIAVGSLLCLAAAAVALVLILHSGDSRASGEPRTGAEPQPIDGLGDRPSAAAVPEISAAAPAPKNEPRVDPTGAPLETTPSATATPTQAAQVRPKSPKSSVPVNSASPVFPSAKRPPTLSPSAPGGNPLIL